MNFLWFVLLSLASGVVAGMGMGGGTLLLPALTLIMGVDQQVAQGINLAVFVPMAIVVCIIYTKNKLIDYKIAWIIALPAIGVSVLSSLLAVKLEGKVLMIIFGVFIALIGIATLISSIVLLKKQYKKT
ncbi:MAG: sulfite exporter TauE/SafE family protein [Clostridia bacterium]